MANPTDKRFHQLTLAIQKAINSIETPVKEKHVRSTIIGTFQEQSAVTYWMVAIRLPLQDNRIVSWKFCHVTHKLLREGHPACLDDSQRHIGMIENLGKLWVHLREGYGRLIHLYCNLLVCKLRFHQRNPRFPGNMQLTADELDAIAENDVNNYFQLCVELFDYMDEILNLQAAVFDSLGNARANSMTASGQCRLAALIPCAQDASHMYDCNVRLLFRLHAALPPDTLAGHRERFRQQFKKLSSFYKHASSLQYYRNLLTLPVLPSNPPNFLLQSDFGTYVTPVVTIPEPPPDEVDSVGALIDTSDTISQASNFDHMEMFDTRTTPSPQPDPIVERDRLIDHLQNELKRMRTEVSQLVQERNTMLGSMREHCTRLETQLQATQSELEEERHKAVVLSTETPEIKKKLSETEEKAKLTDDKFQKLKGAYTQLREEHINLIRQKAEVDKMASSLRAASVQHESAKMLLQQQLNDRIKDVELLQQSASSSEEIEAYKSEITNLRTELENSRQKEVELENLKASMEALQIEHKAAATEQQEKVIVMENELKEVTENLERLQREKEDQESELNRTKEELQGLKMKSGEDIQKVMDEKEVALKDIVELKQRYQQEKEAQTYYINKLETDLQSLQHKLTIAETTFTTQYQKLDEELTAKNKEFDDIINEKDSKIKDALENLEKLQTRLDFNTKNYNQILEENISLQHRVDEIKENKLISDDLTVRLEAEIRSLKANLDEEKNEKNKYQNIITERENDIIKLKNTIREIDNCKNVTINELCDKQKSQEGILLEKITDLETTLAKKDEEEKKTLLCFEKQKNEFNAYQNEFKIETTLLQEKIKNISESKNDVIQNFKEIIADKDKQVIALNLEVNKLSDEVMRLTDELKETNAELEIGNNELLHLKDELDNVISRNEENLTLKNNELRTLNDEISKTSLDIKYIEAEKERIVSELVKEKQVLENKLEEITETVVVLKNNIIDIQSEKVEVENKLNAEIERINFKTEQVIIDKENEIKVLNDVIVEQRTNFEQQITEKKEDVLKAQREINEFKIQLDELEKFKIKEKREMDSALDEKEKDYQMIEARLAHIENERLNAECELQDLLQHNTALEADVAELRIQLQNAQATIQKQNIRLVTCAGEAALEVTNGAFEAFEQSNIQETHRLAAELAVKALDELARHTEIGGNEESVAKSAIYAAHNAAKLSTYMMEVSNVSTDLELADKLNSECRTMLSATKQCLESVRSGSVESTACVSARASVRTAAATAARADREPTARTVDDELADMDRAIEDAAMQIEELLAASRAGDSGVKLEVNEKILDACTTLMGAVKILVQDARKLQNELGDPKTRQKMYRRNPQWSEGLISAAKAVVFAAKLLVSSADEAVGGRGRVEGVSAAAHEVAGSTAQLVAASRARAPPSAPALSRLTAASRHVAAAAGAVLAAVRHASDLTTQQEALDTSALTLTATRRLEMESKVRSLELETALEAERARLAALRKRHYHLAQLEENGNMTNGKE